MNSLFLSIHSLFLSILMGSAVFLIIMIVGLLTLDNMKDVNTFIQCCNGSQCTDTYYVEQDNTCHLVLCENSAFTNKKDCVYRGANITNVVDHL